MSTLIAIGLICGLGLYVWRSRRGRSPEESFSLTVEAEPIPERPHPDEPARDPSPPRSPDEVRWPEDKRPESPYRSPFPRGAARPDQPHPGLTASLADVPKQEALDRIRHAALAGAISATITAIVVLAQMSGANLAEGVVNLSSTLDVALIIGLAYAVSRASRVAAIALFGYFVLSRILVWMTMGSLSGLPVAILFGYFLFQGIRGTFQYHALPDPPPLPSRPLVTAVAAISGFGFLAAFSVSFYGALFAGPERSSEAEVEVEAEATGDRTTYFAYLNGGPESFQLQVVDLIDEEWQTIAWAEVSQLSCNFTLTELEEQLVTLVMSPDESELPRLTWDDEETAAVGAGRSCEVGSLVEAAN